MQKTIGAACIIHTTDPYVFILSKNSFNTGLEFVKRRKGIQNFNL